MYQDEFISRFWKNIQKTDYCWNWVGLKDKCGYGVIKFHQKALKAHRIVIELTGIEIPSGICVLHKCDNSACVNPNHLYLGTPADNARDRSSRKRNGDICGEKNGRAKLNNDQVIKIREIYETQHLSKVKLGEMFGVSNVQIGHIIHYLQWKG